MSYKKLSLQERHYIEIELKEDIINLLILMLMESKGLSY